MCYQDELVLPPGEPAINYAESLKGSTLHMRLDGRLVLKIEILCHFSGNQKETNLSCYYLFYPVLGLSQKAKPHKCGLTCFGPPTKQGP